MRRSKIPARTTRTRLATDDTRTTLATRATGRLCVLALLRVNAALLNAQSTSPSAWGRAPDATGALSSSSGAWFGAWSPLRPIADLERGLLRAPLSPGVGILPAPVAGAFGLAGAPAALARDFLSASDSVRFSEFGVRIANESGDFRRPFDVAQSTVVGVFGRGWSPVGTRGFATGNFVVDREINDVSSFTSRLSPYTSSPFVAADSVMPTMQRTRARLEGALSLRLAQFGVGLSAALEANELNSVNAPLRRAGRATTPAVNVGVERTLPWLGIRLGVYRRWTEPNETDFLNPAPLPTTFFPVQGLDEPPSLPLTGGKSLFVRTDRRATANGATLSTVAVGVHAVMTYERGRRAEDSYSIEFSQARPIDRWRANGSDFRLELQRQFRRSIRATIVGANERVNGDATRNDLTGVAYRSRELRRSVEGDIRLNSIGWEFALLGGAVHTERKQTDFVAVRTALTSSTIPFAGVEIGRVLAPLSIRIGASVATSSSSANLPPVVNAGPNYRRLIAPQLSYEAAEARAYSAWLTASTRLRQTTMLVTARIENASPVAAAPTRLQPTGSRNGLSIEFGVRP